MVQITIPGWCLAVNPDREYYQPNKWHTLEVIHGTYLAVHFDPETCKGDPTFVSISTELLVRNFSYFDGLILTREVLGVEIGARSLG